MKKYTRNIYKVQYTWNGVYADLNDRMAAILQNRQNELVEHKTLVYTDESNTLKGFSVNVDTSDLIVGAYESEATEIIKNK